MSVLNENQLLGAPAGSSQYQIQRSLRFNSADSAYLSRTPASAGNRKTWTWSGWVKRSALGSDQTLFASSNSIGSVHTGFKFFSSDQITIYSSGATSDITVTTTQVFRDTSSWFHVVIAFDSTQATASDRLKLYVNGSQVTSFGTATYPTQNTDLFINQAAEHSIGRYSLYNQWYSSLYLADIHFIDGQALTPSSFGETDATTGEWIPKAYTGTYGTNGFKLNFSNNSAATATTLGADSSGNGNNWTPNNLSVTAGAGNDSLVDTPTSYGTDTGVGGEVRGNYCTFNPLDKGSTITLANGNLDYSQSSSGLVTATVGVSSGKWYWEVTPSTVDNTVFGGVKQGSGYSYSNYVGSSGIAFGWAQNANAFASGLTLVGSSGNNYTSGDVIGIALDLDAGTAKAYKNGVLMGYSMSGLTGTWFPACGTNTVAGTSSVNFGQRPFAYTPPAGHKALCDTNLPAPTIVKPSTVMDTVLYTGTGASLTPTSSLGFSPDLVWMKARSNAYNHALYDTVRGATLELSSNQTIAEATMVGGLTAFNSNGFSVGGNLSVNTQNVTYAAWCWDAGSSTVVNSQGTLGGAIRANASAGFSIVQFVSPGAGNGTVGHGLGVAPSLIIAKNQVGNSNWTVYHSSATTISQYLVLNGTSAATTLTNVWGNASPTSTVFGINSSNQGASTTCIAYCFAPVAGYSAFGSYTGNGSADGPFVYTGFRPRWILLKDITTAGGDNWHILDSARLGYNVDNNILYPNTASSEPATDVLDLLSNGFKFRNIGIGNASATTYIYAAFAEFPFQYARAR